MHGSYRRVVGLPGEKPKVSCPLHMKPFAVETSVSLSGKNYSVMVFLVKVPGGQIHLQLPLKEQINELALTSVHTAGSESAE